MRRVPKLSTTSSLYSIRDRGRDGEGQHPPVGVAELLEGEVVCDADAEVHQADTDDLAVMGERACLPIDDRERLTVGRDAAGGALA